MANTTCFPCIWLTSTDLVAAMFKMEMVFVRSPFQRDNQLPIRSSEVCFAGFCILRDLIRIKEYRRKCSAHGFIGCRGCQGVVVWRGNAESQDDGSSPYSLLGAKQQRQHPRVSMEFSIGGGFRSVARSGESGGECRTRYLMIRGSGETILYFVLGVDALQLAAEFVGRDFGHNSSEWVSIVGAC